MSWRRWARVARQADQISVRASGSLKAIDVDLNHIPDAAMTLATLASLQRHYAHPKYLQLEDQRNRSYDRNGNRIEKSRRHHYNYGRQHHYHAAGRAKTRANRDLRRSSDGHVLFATSHEQRAPSHREPRGHRQNLPRLWKRSPQLPLTGKSRPILDRLQISGRKQIRYRIPFFNQLCFSADIFAWENSFTSRP